MNKRSQEQPEAASSSQESQEQPAAARSSQEQPDAKPTTTTKVGKISHKA